MSLKNRVCSVLILLAVCCVAAGEQKNVLVVCCPETAEFSGMLMKPDAGMLFTALEKSGAASGKREMVSSAELLKKEAFDKAAYNHLVVIGRKGGDPLLEKCWGHQAAIDPETKTFYRLGYGTLRGDIGYVECDWNPFLYSSKVRTNTFTTVIVKISGTSVAGVRAALEAFRKGLLNGVVPAGKMERVKKSILDRDPDSTPPPRLPREVRVGDRNAYLCGWTQPSEEEYRAFLDMCTGVLEGELLTVYAPDDITLGRLDNDRVRGALTDEAADGGITVRVAFRTGEPPRATPRENLQNLLKFGSQFDNIEIK